MNTCPCKLIAAVSLCAGILGAVSGTTQASLVDRGGGLIYDTDLNVTWQANARLAMTNTFGVSGINTYGYMSWNTAQSWIGAMNSANYLGYSNWRLPATLQPDWSCSAQSQAKGSYGWHCVGSEMGHLFYNELGGVGGYSIATYHNSNYTLFSNLPSTFWSTESTYDTRNAWMFGFQGGQDVAGKTSSVSAWAVRDGDVASVPIPATACLLSTGLVGLIGMARRKAA